MERKPLIPLPNSVRRALGMSVPNRSARRRRTYGSVRPPVAAPRRQRPTGGMPAGRHGWNDRPTKVPMARLKEQRRARNRMARASRKANR